MKEIDKIKENYSKALENYRVNNPVIHDVAHQKNNICGLCGASVKVNELQTHMDNHSILPPSDLAYQLCEPFRMVNVMIQKGAKFVKLIWLISQNPSSDYPFGRGESVPYNGLFLKDRTKLTDTDNIKIRWNAKERRFVKWFWDSILL